ncbi:hypothetical protein [Pelotomaculum sp. FP]|uniref:hypothetical protein n=1 Tax=Pelotomaculum sp. FP TaxID=261474 RepID=UPI001863B536|nr:hypothetical protein [Pelotomaculum sp. FP]
MHHASHRRFGGGRSIGRCRGCGGFGFGRDLQRDRGHRHNRREHCGESGQR